MDKPSCTQRRHKMGTSNNPAWTAGMPLICERAALEARISGTQSTTTRICRGSTFLISFQRLWTACVASLSRGGRKENGWTAAAEAGGLLQCWDRYLIKIKRYVSARVAGAPILNANSCSDGAGRTQTYVRTRTLSHSPENRKRLARFSARARVETSV